MINDEMKYLKDEDPVENAITKLDSGDEFSALLTSNFIVFITFRKWATICLG